MNAEYAVYQPQPQRPPVSAKPDLSCAVAGGIARGRGIAALFCLIAVYFGIDSLLHQQLSVMAGISAVMALLISALVLYTNGARFRIKQIPLFLATLICGASMAVMASAVTKATALFAYTVLLFYWIYTVCRPRQRGDGNAHTFIDLLFAWFTMPFAGFGGLIETLFCRDRKKKQNASLTLLWTLLGLLIALPITFLVAWLLLRCDELFERIIAVILDNIWIIIRDFVTSALVAIPFASALYSALDTGLSNHFPRERLGKNTEEGVAALRILPNAAVLAATLPLIALYLLFFGIQAGYFLSAFRNYLPDGYTFAEYARRGFFELCIVAVINLFLILAALFFCRRSEKKKGGILRFVTASLSLLTAALMVIAISKMVMYISSYGLSRSRVYTAAFMLLLGIIFLLLFIYAVAKRFCVLRWIFAAFVVLVVCFSAVDLDRVIVAFNVDRYLDGYTKELDLSYVSELSPAAAAELIPAAENAKDADIRINAKRLISNFLREYEKKDFFAKGISEHTAYRKLKKCGYTIQESDLRLTLTIRLESYYLPLREIEVVGKDFSLSITATELEKALHDEQYIVDCTPLVLTEQNVYFILTDSDGYQMYSNDVTLAPDDGAVYFEIRNNDYEDGEIWTDLIAERVSVVTA